MKGYVANIEEATKQNQFFRKVLYTGKHSQLVVMSLKPKEEIGEEVHHLDQFLRVEEGEGVAILDGVEHRIAAEWAIVVPAGTKHNVINTSADRAMKLYTIYSPAEHKDKVVHVTKEDAMKDESDHFDGITTE